MIFEQEVNVEDDFEEWTILSQLIPPNNVNVSDLHTLGRRDFDISFNWEKQLFQMMLQKKLLIL
jgi:hypothetical protein